MKRKISFLLTLVLIMVPLSFSYSEGNNHRIDLENVEKYSGEVSNYISDLMNEGSQMLNNEHIDENNNIKPRYVEHHTCFRGGTSCAECRYERLTRSCGCVFIVNYCCCGDRMSTEALFCKEHYVR